MFISNFNSFNCTRIVMTFVGRLTRVNYCNCHHFSSLGQGKGQTSASVAAVKPKPKNDKKIDELEGSSISSLKSVRDQYQEKTNAKLESLKVSLAEDNWTPIYSFNHIGIAQLIQRAKLFQTGLTCCFILPISLGSYLYGVTSLFSLQLTVGGSLFACMMLYIMGTLSSRIVGRIYISDKKPHLARIARLNFFGKRVDGEYDKNEFVPISDLPDNPSDIYCNLKRYTSDDDDNEDNKIMYITFKYGSILNQKEFEDIFGTIPLPNKSKK